MSAALAFQVSPENIIGDWGDFESWANGVSSAPDGWKMLGTAGSVAREATSIKFGAYGLKIISGASGSYAAELTYDLIINTIIQEGIKFQANNFYPGRTVTFGMWVKCDTASKARIYIDDGFTKTYSSYHTGGNTFEWLTVSVQINTASTQMKFGCDVASASVIAYFDGGIACDGELLLTDFRGNNIYVRENDFDPSVTYSLGSFIIPRKEGSQIQTVVMREGKLKLKVQIWSTDFPTARTIYDTIIRAVSDGRKEIRFADDRVYKGILSAVGSLNFMAGAAVYTFDITFALPRPVQQYISRLRTQQAVSSSPTSFDVSVAGSLKTFPVIHFLPPAGVTISSVTFENQTTGQRFSFSQNVPPGATLTVDCDSFVVLNNGVDGLSYMTGDIDMKLVPGTNKMKFTGTAGITIQVDEFNNYL